MEGSMNAISGLACLVLLSAPADTVLLQFSTKTCPHCQAMQPVVTRLAQQGVNVQVIDAEQRTDLRSQFRVNGVPTFVAVSGGKEVGRIEGGASYERLVALVQETGDRSQGTGDREQSVSAAPIQNPKSKIQNLPPDQAARAATVRIKVEDATGYGFGTGTIIDRHENEALVVTCGHLFRESKGKGKITTDVFVGGPAQSFEGQLITYDLDRDIALISVRVPPGLQAAAVAPPGYTVRPGDRAFTLGCDKGADPSVRTTHITAVNKYKGKPNFTAAGQPVDGRSGGGLFTAEGYLIGVCNAADPADDEGLYAGLASIHWQLDQIGQAEVYQRAARAATIAAGTGGALPMRDPSTAGQASSATPAVALTSAQVPASPPPQLPAQMPGTSSLALGVPAASPAPPDLQPVAAAGDDTEIVFIVRSKRNPTQNSEVYVVDQAPPDLIARITHAARSSGEQRAALARAAMQTSRTATANAGPASPTVVRGQSNEY
jgi:thiol-disulfide isomerase/thioredoxin